MKKALIALVALLALTGAACESDADVAAGNLSAAAERFEVQRRIVFINGITDEYLLTIEGLCSVETAESALGGSLEVTCKVGPDDYKKHFLGLSDNVTYLVEQTDNGTSVSNYRYRVVFKPGSIVPDFG
jgi:hypothetical protein